MVFILNFHGLGPRRPGLSAGEEECWLDQSFFEAILDCVQERKDVQITLDDSNESDYTIALPALKTRNMRAKFFAVAQRLDQNGYLSASHLQTLAAEGMVIGSHGMRHRRWTGLNAEGLDEELVEARNRLEQIVGKAVQEAACPFGSYDRRVLRGLRKHGYDAVYTSDEGPAQRTAWIRPRNTVRRSDDLAKIQRTISGMPAGLEKIWRETKLKLKQLR
jgi:peptidoglycan/xylan/chitin deacetylase (PgdA/CDA1 family)